MKIALIHNSYSKTVTSGAQRIVKNLADYLVSRQHEVVIIACGKSREVEIVKDNLIKIIYLPSDFYKLSRWPTWRRLVSHIFGFFNFRLYTSLRQIIKQENFDLIWTHNLIGFGLIAARAIKAKIKLHTCHDIQLLYPSGLLMFNQENILNSPLAYIYRFFCRLVFAKDTLIVFPSQWLSDLTAKFKLFTNNQKIVLANPLAQIKNFPKPEAINNFTFLFLGQIEKHKGVDLLISAFEKIEDTNCQLLVAGDGSLLNDLKKTTDQRIKFLGNTEKPEEIISQVSCVVVPSLCYENLPTAALEAMQNNIPVIGSALGGLKTIINNEKLLFKPIEEEIKKTLQWCLANQEELKTVSALARQQFKLLSVEDYLREIGNLVKVGF